MAAAHPHAAAGGTAYTRLTSIGLTSLQASHHVSCALQGGLNAFYAEELGNSDGLFHGVWNFYIMILSL
jgi:hypothetical protein